MSYDMPEDDEPVGASIPEVVMHGCLTGLVITAALVLLIVLFR